MSDVWGHDRGRLFFTIGHSTRQLEEFLALLEQHEVRLLVDIRKLPGSNRYPQFNADSLEAVLASRDIALARWEALTGRRPVSKVVPFEVNAWWQNRSFHNYADHALSPEFREALAELRRAEPAQRTAIMCSEGVWWRCHRRIIADYLLAAGDRVQHILGEGREEAAQLSEGAVLEGEDRVTYPASR